MPDLPLNSLQFSLGPLLPIEERKPQDGEEERNPYERSAWPPCECGLPNCRPDSTVRLGK